MHSLSLFIFIALLYVMVFFAIAWWGDKKPLHSRLHPWVYGLSLTIFCTSWSFYGATAQFAGQGWYFSPVHLGAIVLLVFGFSFWQKLVRVAKQENATSLSDFITSRYGNSRTVALLVALISLFAVIPYIALQLQAMSVSFSLVSNTPVVTNYWFQDIALYIALVMAAVAMLLGTRHLDATKHNSGMLLAVAAEAIVKLVVFLVLGYWAVQSIGGGFVPLLRDSLAASATETLFNGFNDSYIYTTQMLLGLLAIFVLPRQFQLAVVDCRNDQDLQKSRWILPSYLILFNLFIAPLAAVGLLHVNADASQLEHLVLTLPLLHGRDDLVLLAFIGGLSAATSMLIVSTISLSTMLSNDLVLPMLIRFSIFRAESKRMASIILTVRRLGIVAILLAAFSYYRLVGSAHSLLLTGLVALVAVAQFVPSVVIGLFWTGVNRKGVIWGLSLGFLTWFYTLMLPMAAQTWLGTEALQQWLQQQSIFNPYALFGVDGLTPVVHATAWSLALNVLGLLLGSAYSQVSLKDRIQASRIVQQSAKEPAENQYSGITVADLYSLMSQFIAIEKLSSLFHGYTHPVTHRISKDGIADDRLIRNSERMLSSVMGLPAARLLFEEVEKIRLQGWGDVDNIVTEASQVFKFNRDILNSALQSINQGISIVDQQFNLVAWNKTYQQMFDYPEHLLVVGTPIIDLVRYNAEQGEYGEGSVAQLVEQRMAFLYRAENYKTERKVKDGRYINILGRPMDEGGYITVYTDVTEYRLITEQLKHSNEDLEMQVDKRTEALRQSNSELEKANVELEKANINKTKFLAAAGHDLVQPLNSAALFTASLQSRLNDSQESDELKLLCEKIESSLQSADSLLSELLDISKLDSDIIKPSISTFSLSSMLQSLQAEFAIIAEQRNVDFTLVVSSAVVVSDARLLRRILQNLISNAIKYSHSGRVLVGVRRHQQQLRIEVIDTGPGLSEQQCKVIFDEFYRVPEYAQKEQGLGLGLSIVKRMSELLDHPLSVESTLGKGSCFSVSVPKGDSLPVASQSKLEAVERGADWRILCVDNEQQIIDGMQSLMQAWGYQVDVALDEQAADQHIQKSQPELVIIDFHLNNEVTGLEVIDRWQQSWMQQTPVIVITADYTDEVRHATKDKGYYLLKKPIRPLQLKALLEKILA
ncbi:hybrid sensor histidine kinase/response regulator [Reinekea thalattae]|uniref:histidine kinase n=1 Tax=Reinekea thalattae TaxID=2593301 RepID=A0A5C8Z941_9GAMM|nr:NahK/ErcS family hybrid sensor histidine kinase/response regulator [Reinekea thalattae]TXR53366.1 response regulator [Reinekea thalattae]